ncbi:MAG: DUF3737 family protein [Clostridia bacterium]|nr:DUF3737 family protein [Clostridia bacterium]
MIYSNKTYDEERALYGIRDSKVENCVFDGPADGESALKESKNIVVEGCRFNLRYPFWHVDDATVTNVTMTENCRAALWYDNDVVIKDSRLHGIKALRECQGITLENCDICSEEFCWKVDGIVINGCKLVSQYPFFECRDMTVESLDMTGKYSFQYIENAEIRNCIFKTKDAFWHAKNVTVYDSVIEGEYLAWYSENLRLVNCKITGTQPFCYCRGLVLENCTMEDTDLCFENSEVEADVKGNIISVKNPLGGFVRADSIGEIIWDDEHRERSRCNVTALADSALWETVK